MWRLLPPASPPGVLLGPAEPCLEARSQLRRDSFPGSLLSLGEAWSHSGLSLETQFAPWRLRSSLRVCARACVGGRGGQDGKDTVAVKQLFWVRYQAAAFQMKQEGFGVISSFFIIFRGFSLLPQHPDFIQ